MHRVLEAQVELSREFSLLVFLLLVELLRRCPYLFEVEVVLLGQFSYMRPFKLKRADIVEETGEVARLQLGLNLLHYLGHRVLG